MPSLEQRVNWIRSNLNMIAVHLDKQKGDPGSEGFAMSVYAEGVLQEFERLIDSITIRRDS
jgi:hypothetical protein